jgi:hypothetical protein
MITANNIEDKKAKQDEHDGINNWVHINSL